MNITPDTVLATIAEEGGRMRASDIADRFPEDHEVRAGLMLQLNDSLTKLEEQGQITFTVQHGNKYWVVVQ